MELLVSLSPDSLSLPNTGAPVQPSSASRAPNDGAMDFERKEMHTVFASREELLAYTTTFSLAQGYAVVIHKSNIPRGQLWLRCDLGGPARNPVSAEEPKRKRRAAQRQRNCPFQLYGRRLADGKWVLKIQNDVHTHEPASGNQDLEAHPAARRLSNAQKRVVLELTDKGVRPAVIVERLREKFPDKPIKVQDIYNARNFIRTERLAGRVPFGGAHGEAGEAEIVHEGDISPFVTNQANQSSNSSSSGPDKLDAFWASVVEKASSWSAEKQSDFIKDVQRLVETYSADEAVDPTERGGSQLEDHGVETSEQPLVEETPAHSVEHAESPEGHQIGISK